MNPKTLLAREQSIIHWEGIVAGTEPCGCAPSCSLCQRFLLSDEAENGYDCMLMDGERCPVYIASGVPGCSNTPWEAWDDECDTTGTRFADTPRKKKLAQAELDFLRGLLPQTEQTEKECTT